MKAKKSFIWLGILLLATIWILVRKNNVPYHSINGLVFGTIYNITYQYDGDLKSEIEAELKRFDGSLSPFNDTSIISRINRNEEIVTDSFFKPVSIVPWRYRKKPMALSTSQSPLWQMSGDSVLKRESFRIQ